MAASTALERAGRGRPAVTSLGGRRHVKFVTPDIAVKAGVTASAS